LSLIVVACAFVAVHRERFLLHPDGSFRCSTPGVARLFDTSSLANLG
jgi:hypothetical protein